VNRLKAKEKFGFMISKIETIDISRFVFGRGIG
jgi:hypothetical protein